jgi:histidine transport system substrate-binding protein
LKLSPIRARKIYADLTAGRIDAAFQDEVAASEGFLKTPVGKDYKFGGPSIKDVKLFGVGTGMGLRKEDNEREALNKAFAEMRADGTYDKLAKSTLILMFTAANRPVK